MIDAYNSIVRDIKQDKEDIIQCKFGIEVLREHFMNIVDKVFIKDEIIDFHLKMLLEFVNFNKNGRKVWLMNTKFLTMWFDETKKGRSYSLRYHKKQDFGYFQTKEIEFKIFMIPVYFDDHWMLIIVDLDSMQMYWYDSLL